MVYLAGNLGAWVRIADVNSTRVNLRMRNVYCHDNMMWCTSEQFQNVATIEALEAAASYNLHPRKI